VSDPSPLLRFSSLAEAVSYLLLLGVAMPLKYAAGMPLAVSIAGMVHGVLFLLLIWFGVRSCIEKGWPQSRIWLVIAASLVPLWPFFLDRKMRRWVAEGRAAVE